MTPTDRQDHWQNVYTTKGENEVSWFQDTPNVSLDLIAAGATGLDSAIVDIGGGASRLVDALVERGYRSVTVLDLSPAALAMAKERLGANADGVHWVAADVTTWKPAAQFDVWHDRAAFHFLTDPRDRKAYVTRLTQALRRGGQAVIGTFSLRGPEKCSGLSVVRYDAVSLNSALGPEFKLLESRDEEHRTPWGASQHFQFSRFSFAG